ncbi:isoprenylcysteine carboxyl methyltransferase family protein [Pyxidicoccus parkwayensis]|uniref:Isoprenylcysteine carboxyl methyltransferase family protein n=1 Tax=Pyxidicoccus parkwayensis TaxID=2813578 RepID=A0ABX7NUN8_9BACT|nr:isoprenylcysteine carboxyl methyltransferase family protein [Pyxidicoccus parkwaysis]QSQ22620.1 isoprenylcysteine carboxyl methyltransferase family protein [Pyxidicoccus parkwaysis]
MVTFPQAVFLGFMALLVVERLVELVLSKRNADRAFARGGVETGQGHYRFMVVFHTLFLGACVAEVLVLRTPFPGAWGWAALGGAVAAQALRYWAIGTLGDRWNSRIIVVPELPPVTGGPYRFLRHPNYVAVVLELACVPLIHGAWRTAFIFSVGNAVLLFVRIRAEEAALGDAYARAFAHRPRFIPEVPRE